MSRKSVRGFSEYRASFLVFQTFFSHSKTNLSKAYPGSRDSWWRMEINTGGSAVTLVCLALDHDFLYITVPNTVSRIPTRHFVLPSLIRYFEFFYLLLLSDDSNSITVYIPSPELRSAHGFDSCQNIRSATGKWVQFFSTVIYLPSFTQQNHCQPCRQKTAAGGTM